MVPPPRPTFFKISNPPKCTTRRDVLKKVGLGGRGGGVVYIYIYIYMYMGGCQDYGPFLDPYYNTAPNI